jgi:iron complex outermembrane recepter protein
MPASRLTPITLGLSALLCAGFACAATTLPATSISAEADEDDPRVKDTNTATRTSTPVRYVPQAIDSVKTENLRAYGINDAGPGPERHSQRQQHGADTRFDSLRIRGFDASNDFYLDGIRDDSQYVRDLHNIERIDVLKGPAAVLYGRGGQGGIINRVSKTPQYGRASSIRGPRGHGRFAQPVRRHQRRPDREHQPAPEHGQRRHRQLPRSRQRQPQTVRAVDELANHPGTQLVGAVRIQPLRPHPGPWHPERCAGGLPMSAVAPPMAAHDIIDDKTQSLRSRLSYDVNDNWQLRHTLGIFKLDSQFENTYLTGYDPKTRTVNRQSWQQDLTTRNVFNNLEIEGVFDTFGLEHRLLTGLELGSQRRDPKLYSAKGVPGVDLYNPDRRLRPTGPMTLSSDNHTEVDSQGLYVQDQIRLNDQWQVLAGLRHDRFEVDTTSNLKNPLGNPSTVTTLARGWGWSGRRWKTTPSMPRGPRPSPRWAAV